MSYFQKVLDHIRIQDFEKDLSFNDLILEFANMDPEEHKFGVDVNLHIYQPGNIKFSHGPRIKIFKNKPGTDFTITLEEKPEVICNWKLIVSKKELNILLKNIKKYRSAFITFWNDPAMSIRKLELLMKEIDKN